LQICDILSYLSWDKNPTSVEVGFTTSSPSPK
jgi:hypothetical protein